MNQKEQKIYRKIVSAQFEPYDPGEKPYRRPRPFQRRMLARMVIDICRRVRVTRICRPKIDQWGEMGSVLCTEDVHIMVSVNREGGWFAWLNISEYARGKHKQRTRGVRVAVRWLK